jgi:hypothetical protein
VLRATLGDTLIEAAMCDLEDHQPARALARIDRVVAMLGPLDADRAPRGGVYLARWMALVALGRTAEARAAARTSLANLTGDALTAPSQAEMRRWLAAHGG